MKGVGGMKELTVAYDVFVFADDGAKEYGEAAFKMLIDAELAERLGKTEKNVNNRIPYEKGIYNAEYPSKNALKIRKCREKGGTK